MVDDPISLGMGAADGFSGSDLTSPAIAGEAGAIPDALHAPLQADGRHDRRWLVTELRVHGVSGSDGPTMLAHPIAVQVAGDSVTQFYRRWTPAGRGGDAVPWRLEAYSWGGLTEAPLAAASWVLLAPFMLFNVAHFMLPRTADRKVKRDREHSWLSRDRKHAVAAALLRLLAVTATVEFALTGVAVLVNVLAYQGRQAQVPSWMEALTRRSADVRVGLAIVAVTLLIAALWWVSVVTANRYEARVSTSRSALADSPLTQPTFWCGHELVHRQRSLHAAAALTVTALVVARPAGHASPFAWGVAAAAAGVLAAVLIFLCLPLADRHTVVVSRAAPVGARGRRSAIRWLAGRPAAAATTRGTRWCRGLLIAAVLVVVASLFVGGWRDPEKPIPRTIVGFTAAWLALLGMQAVLLVAVWLAVWRCARGVRPKQPNPDCDPFLSGHLTTVVAAIGVWAGGLLSCLLVLLVARLLGTPVPNGARATNLPAHALEVPWPLYAFAAAPIGVVIAAIITGIWLFSGWRHDVRLFTSTKKAASSVDRYYEISANTGDNPVPATEESRLRVARAWATALLTDRAPTVALLLSCGALVAVIAAMVLPSPSGFLKTPLVPGIASAEGVVGLFLAALLVALLRRAYQDPSERKAIGAVWDVATFWPRAAHPFAPPCYAERAIPELVDRIRVLTGHVEENTTDPAWLSIVAHRPNPGQPARATLPPGPLLLTGYSQGSVIAAAVIAQLPTDVVHDVALLTLACPARRLYGRAFPAYFGVQEMGVLAHRLSGVDQLEQWPEQFDGVRGRWRNLVRETDYIGSWVQKGAAASGPDSLRSDLDQRCPDPPVLTSDLYPTPPPSHRHSDFWPDPCTNRLGEHLIDQLLDVRKAEDQRKDAKELDALFKKLGSFARGWLFP